MANVTFKTRDKPEYHVVDAIRKLQTDKIVPQKNHWQTMLKISSIPDLKSPTAAKIMDSLNIMMQRTTNENAAGLRRICKRKSNQPNIERL